VAISVRESPPLRLHLSAETPEGRTFRWGQDEPKPENVPSGLSFSTTIPGGFERAGCVLPRKPGVDYSDLERFSTLYVKGAGGEPAWEGRLEGAPRTSGNQMAVTPNAVGWQAHLDDNKGVSEVYIDRDLGRWGDASIQRKINAIAVSWREAASPTTGAQDSGATGPGVSFQFSRFDGTYIEYGEAWYYGQGVDIGQLRYDFNAPSLAADANWLDQAYITDTDIYGSAFDQGSDHNQTAATNQSVTATDSGRKYAAVLSRFVASGVADLNIVHQWLNLRVLGRHGLTAQGTQPAEGFYASQIIENAIPRFAPLLSVTGESITDTSFVIPQAAYWEATAGDIVNDVNRYHLYDWAVWDDRVFWYYPRTAYGRRWRARMGPANLAETGPSVERVYNEVIVKYQGADGISRSVGPVGAAVSTESALLTDLDPENPATAAGVTRRAILSMKGISSAVAAIQVGQRFLEETRLVDRSGSAELVGTVEDDKGVVWPAWMVRAGDYISFIDASDSSNRRIVRASYNDSSRTNSIDLDAPPEALDALLERLNAVLIPHGL
jgi:hypothetical protein